MKKVFISLLFFVSLYTAHAQKSSTTPVITRYMLFTGSIDKYPVTFHLYQINNEFSGCYYYNSTEEPIDLSGKMDKDHHYLKLNHKSGENDVLETIEGTFSDSTFSGTWSSKGKMLPFRITRKKDTSSLAFDYIWTKGLKKYRRNMRMTPTNYHMKPLLYGQLPHRNSLQRI